jgi:methylase of polypeptide subunit release factors
LLDPEAIEPITRLRTTLERQGYLSPEATEILGQSFGLLHHRSDLPLYVRRLSAPRPLHTLLKLFNLYVRVTEAETRAALAPLSLEEAISIGVIERIDGEVRATIGLVTTGRLILVRDRVAEGSRELSPEHVIGLNTPAVNLARLTVRRAARRVLDLGCGGGVQALLAASHAEHVVAVDLNPRALLYTRFNARLNGVTNVETREGSFFEPVKGERFDLVVSNPPFTISPDRRFIFRDGGRAGDGVCEEVVRGAAAHLEEGGFATVLCNWALRDGEEPSAPLRRWVASSGCDAWLLVSEVVDPLTYAAGWNRANAEYEAAIDRWLEYYRAQGIARIGLGAVLLRRRTAGPQWVRVDSIHDPVDACDGQIRRMFDDHERLTALDGDAALLAAVLRPNPKQELRQTLEPRPDGGYALTEAELRLTEGLAFRGVVDATTVELLRLCDGRRTLRQALAALENGSIDPKVLEEGAKRAVRRLLALGFLVPVEDRDERRQADGGNLEVA